MELFLVKLFYISLSVKTKHTYNLAEYCPHYIKNNNKKNIVFKIIVGLL